MSRPVRFPCSGRRWLHRGVLTLSAAVLTLATEAGGSTLLPPDPAVTVGQRVPFDGFIDENGRALSLDREVRPWIINPMYTRCPSTCSAITANLRRALDQSGLAPSEYRVLSFSFDPNETADGLREFRTRMQLPAEWLVLRAPNRQALERTLKSLDFRTITLGDGNFEHPNLVAVLAPDRRLVGYVFGVNFSAAELAATTRQARAGVSAIQPWRPYLLTVAAFGFVASAGAFTWLLLARRGRTTLPV